jgi:hypothetical protein
MRVMLSPSGRNRRKGSALVEGALVITALLGMIGFIVDLGRTLMFEQFYLERAREGARWAAVNSWDTPAVRNHVCYNSATAPNGNPPGLLFLTPSQVTVSRLGTAGGPDDRIQIKISGIPLFDWVPGLRGAYTTAPVVATAPVQSLGITN